MKNFSFFNLNLKKTTAEAKNDEKTDSSWDELEKRDNMLEGLLILLNSAASLGFGPNPAVFSSSFTQQRAFTSEFPGKKFSKDLNDISPNETHKSSYIPHYQLVY